MKTRLIQIYCTMLAFLLAISAVTLSPFMASAEGAFTHALSESATAEDKAALEELMAMDPSHIHDYTTDDFRLAYADHFGDSFQDEADAHGGKAAVMTAESRTGESNNTLNLNNNVLPINVAYDGGVTEGGALSMADIIADGAYHLYKIADVVLVTMEENMYLYMFHDWGFQVVAVPDDLQSVRGEKVDIYLSMKITGDITFKDKENLPVYHIDRLVITEKCESFDVEFTDKVDATCISDAIQKGICSKCGKTIAIPESGTKLEHSFTNYVTSEDGSKTAECDYGCGTTDVIEALVPETNEPTEAEDETTAAPEQETEPTDTDYTDADADKLPVTLLVIVVAVIFVLLVVACILLMRAGKVKIALISSVIAVVIIAVVLILLLMGGSGKEPADDTTGQNGTEVTGDSTVETTVPPTTEPLTAENSLDLGKMKIVLPAEATAVEKTAAQELADYINKMTGQTLTTVTEGEAVDAGIYIGDTEFAKTNNVTHPTTAYGEGWAIKAVDGNLVICGDATRGTLYGVYHLLEDALGVRWWTYLEEYVPTLDAALLWNKYDDSGAPAFIYRDMHPGAWHSKTNLFQVRNRLNGWSCNAPVEYGSEENYGPPAHIHTFNRYIPESCFETNPEWFAEVNGGRVSNGQLCLTNEGLIAEFTGKLLNNIKTGNAQADATGNVRPRWYDITPNDMEGHCSCEKCGPSIREHGLSGHLLIFVNKIAEAVAKEYPDVLLKTCAYQSYVEVPLSDVKPAENVVIQYCNIDIDVLHGLNHSNNAKVLEMMTAWKDLVHEDQFFVWDYIVNYNIGGLSPSMYAYADDFQTMYELGVDGYFGEQEDPINTDMWDMKMWLNAKLLEDPYQDMDTLMNEFIYGYYGVAGEYVREYLDYLHSIAEPYSGYSICSGSVTNPKWLKGADVVKANEILDKAFEAADGDETLLVRLRLVRNFLDRTIVERFDRYKKEAEEANVEFNLDKKEVCQRLMDCLNEQNELRGDADYIIGDLIARYSRELNKLK